MPDAKPLLNLKQLDNRILLVQFSRGNLADPESISEFQTQMETLVGTGNHRVLISFENVGHMSSAMLGELIKLRSALTRHSGQLRLAGLSKNLNEVFKITNLVTLFNIHPDVPAAVASFR